MEVKGKEYSSTHLLLSVAADLFSFKGFLVLPHFGEGVGQERKIGAMSHNNTFATSTIIK